MSLEFIAVILKYRIYKGNISLYFNLFLSRLKATIKATTGTASRLYGSCNFL